MSVQWIQERSVSPNVGLGAGVSVATSGIIPTLIVLGVLGLAVYGLVTAVRKDEEV